MAEDRVPFKCWCGSESYKEKRVVAPGYTMMIGGSAPPTRVVGYVCEGCSAAFDNPAKYTAACAQRAAQGS